MHSSSAHFLFSSCFYHGSQPPQHWRGHNQAMFYLRRHQEISRCNNSAMTQFVCGLPPNITTLLACNKTAHQLLITNFLLEWALNNFTTTNGHNNNAMSSAFNHRDWIKGKGRVLQLLLVNLESCSYWITFIICFVLYTYSVVFKLTTHCVMAKLLQKVLVQMRIIDQLKMLSIHYETIHSSSALQCHYQSDWRNFKVEQAL